MKWCDQCYFTMSDIHWERIFLEFSITAAPNGPRDVKFYLVTPESSKKEVCPPGDGNPSWVPIAYDAKTRLSDNRIIFRFSINMAAVTHRSFLENGDWRFCGVSDAYIYPVAISPGDAYNADLWSRIFKYGKNQYAYNVSFSVREISKTHIELILHSYFMHINKKWKKRKYVQEAVTFKGKLKRMYLWLVIMMIRCFYFVFSRLLPKNGDRVLFMTETKDYLWGNLKYIHDRMLERGLDSRFKIRCSCRKSVGNKSSALSWIKTVFRVAASDFVFIDDYAPVFGFFKLYKKTRLIQVWHAGEGFKSVGYSRFGKDGSPFPMGSCHKAYTFALTGAKNLIKVYEEVFGIEKEAFLPTGMARLDHFLDPDHICQVKAGFYKQWPSLEGKKIILFAPTFRGTGQKDAWYDYSRLDLKEIYDFCGRDTVFLVKMHPFVRKSIPIPDRYRDRIMDFSSYPDINELFYITDLLVTDYSSNFYEFSLLKRPILFYTYDREFYELTRGVHRSVAKYAPGKVCDTFQELMTALKTQDYEFDKTCRFVRENFGTYDGHASDRIINQILLNEGETSE